ncbi:MAG: chemotaxis response regulator protein-glutamate methylesterase [Limisphaerales bacterium]
MRIAIVNDVTLAVEAVGRVILARGGHQLAWVARDGIEAVRMCARDLPDLVLMDLIMPRMDGVEATRRIMAQTPCAIVVVTANVTDHASRVFEAMGAGALDAVNTPVLESPGACHGAESLLAKIETVRRFLGASVPNGRETSRLPRLAPISHRPRFLIAIGASAGGPAALADILSRLPIDFPAPIVIVQHVDPQFAPGLATWLAHQTPLPVRLAREHDHPQAGTVLLAGRDTHLVFANPDRLAYAASPADSSYSPSIDVFFKSVDRFWTGCVVGVVLSGMGRDGAEGLRLLRGHGHHTIAQDQATSAVYGMPKIAAEMNAAEEILPLGRIGLRLQEIVGAKQFAHA